MAASGYASLVLLALKLFVPSALSACTSIRATTSYVAIEYAQRFE